eukprot:762431-Hanusia_phi.AAC.1
MLILSCYTIRPLTASSPGKYLDASRQRKANLRWIEDQDQGNVISSALKVFERQKHVKGPCVQTKFLLKSSHDRTRGEVRRESPQCCKADAEFQESNGIRSSAWHLIPGCRGTCRNPVFSEQRGGEGSERYETDNEKVEVSFLLPTLFLLPDLSRLLAAPHPICLCHGGGEDDV